MTQETKRMIQEKVRAGVPEVIPAPTVRQPVTGASATISVAALADELVVEVTGSQGAGSVTLRPAEVNRLRGRFGRGAGFEQWVSERIKDALVSFGGG
jgi:hypothetical protein